MNEMKKVDSDKIMKEWELKPISQEQINVLRFMDVKFPTNITRKEATDIIHDAIDKREANTKVVSKVKAPDNIWKNKK